MQDGRDLAERHMLLGSSRAMKKVRADVNIVAPTEATVLITASVFAKLW